MKILIEIDSTDAWWVTRCRNGNIHTILQTIINHQFEKNINLHGSVVNRRNRKTGTWKFNVIKD